MINDHPIDFLAIYPYSCFLYRAFEIIKERIAVHTTEMFYFRRLHNHVKRN